jgi:DNA invertase Pin-like site-specific DNA recombinase
VETISGLERTRPEFRRRIDPIGEGDALVARRLSLLGRSLNDPASMVDRPAKAGAALISLADGLDTSGEAGPTAELPASAIAMPAQ